MVMRLVPHAGDRGFSLANCHLGEGGPWPLGALRSPVTVTGVAGQSQFRRCRSHRLFPNYTTVRAKVRQPAFAV